MFCMFQQTLLALLTSPAVTPWHIDFFIDRTMMPIDGDELCHVFCDLLCAFHIFFKLLWLYSVSFRPKNPSLAIRIKSRLLTLCSLYNFKIAPNRRLYCFKSFSMPLGWVIICSWGLADNHPWIVVSRISEISAVTDFSAMRMETDPAPGITLKLLMHCMATAYTSTHCHLSFSIVMVSFA